VRPDLFEVLGLPRSYRVDVQALEERHRELTRLLHPDRHAAAGAGARRLALEKTIAVNDAYRTLKDPLRRAVYLLEGHGVDLSESGAHRQALPPAVLAEVLELREELEEARAARDAARIAALAARVRRDRAAALEELGRAFDAGDVAAATRQVSRIRYTDRFLDEVGAYEDADFEERHG
jgi:molecular chaperone HscB